VKSSWLWFTAGEKWATTGDHLLKVKRYVLDRRVNTHVDVIQERVWAGFGPRISGLGLN